MEEDEALEWEEEENDGNNYTTWILNKGWAVGKKMLITGVVISSAPLVLPPLVVISTVGLVCAVPCGFLLASYACAEKLVSTLLPLPKALPFTYEEIRPKDDDYEEYGVDADVASYFDENGFTEEDENGNIKEEVTVDVTDVSVELCKLDYSEDSEEFVKETTGLLEKIRDEGANKNDEGNFELQFDGGKTNETEARKGNIEPGDKDIGFLEVTVPSNVSLPTREDFYSEEKIWKQIDALRAIVGYTATRRTACIDELKALYVFTGVEPPASFSDPSDLVEISSKLRDFMSVVGVK